ncbi:LysR family transcriptional regulator [Catenulispora sp. NF23]|uniref:LysR family transcriptional regulator n=1 Tax=Catenulispora pinistramenti TaxID=2705254 RepID=UPI001BAA6F70|nr:LysR family transcriptional regulator [Catenulispora pinistramenti]MBS2531251.1 LysR family transcriptional regulator [Catenulispora pinistramenti]
MEVRHLRHFLALAEEGAFTRAARRESIVQSGLSSSIRALEKDLGVDLYVKGTRPLRLTAEGNALVPIARTAVRSIESAYEVVSDVSDRLVGRLRVGVFTHIEHLVPLASVLARLTTRFPRLQLVLTQLAWTDRLESVASGKLDCAIVSAGGSVPPTVESVRLASEPFVLMGCHAHPFRRVDTLTIRDLKDERFIDMPTHWAVRSDLDRLFEDANIGYKHVAEVDDWTFAVELLTHNAGLAFVPEGLARHEQYVAHRAVWFRKLDDVRIERPIDFAIPKGHAATPAARFLKAELLATLSR